MSQIVVSGGKSANRNVWEGNYWSDYQGFDRDNNNQGDTPYELYAYADRLWQDAPNAQFFKGSPVLETLDFLERLAPFTDPDLLVRDKKPVMNKFIKTNIKTEGSFSRSAKKAGNEKSEPEGEKKKKTAYEMLLEAQGKD